MGGTYASRKPTSVYRGLYTRGCAVGVGVRPPRGPGGSGSGDSRARMVSLASSTGQPRPTARHRPLNAPKPRNSHAWSGSGHGWPRNGIVYNVRGVLREGVPMKYPAIREYSRRYPIRLKCRTLAVSPAGYYAWIDRPESCRAVHNRIRLSEILVIHRESRETYGSPSIGDALVKRGGTRLVSIAWPGSCAPKGFRPNPSRNSAR